MLLPGRHGEDPNAANDYRYSFQGQEHDDEVKGKGNSVNYKYRMHDPRIGRFFAVDPLASKYPHYTPYQFSGNKVIAFVELEGLEEKSIKEKREAAEKETSSRMNQLKKYTDQKNVPYDNPEALPIGTPLGDVDQDHIYPQAQGSGVTIDNTRNPRRMWLPNCLSSPGVVCEFVQYGRWDETIVPSSVTGDPVITTTSTTRLGNVRPAGAPIISPFNPGTSVPTAAFGGALTTAINNAIALPTPLPIMGLLPTGLGTPGPVTLVSNTTFNSPLLQINTQVTTQTFTRVVNSTTFENVVLFNLGTPRFNLPGARTMMTNRANSVAGSFANPFVPVLLGQILFRNPGRNMAQIFNATRTTNFTTTWTTTVTTTTVRTRRYNFMRNQNDYINVNN